MTVSFPKTLYIVVPCYNEELVLPETANRLMSKIHTLLEEKKVAESSRIVFVDDGSKDKTWEVISDLHLANHYFSGIKLSRNRGHQNALLAGLMTAKDHADLVVSMDADLQDDIDAVDEMIDKFYQGFDIVYGVRSNRQKDTFFKKWSAQTYYKLLSMMGGEIVYNHADYRLMSKRALDALAKFPEVNLFLRGMVPLIGFSSTKVFYERGERFAGESKYPFRKMLSFAIEGITSLSTRPLRLISILGFCVFAISILMLLYAVILWMMNDVVLGWAIGGLILLSLGVIGEYIGKLYLESKNRPRFIIEKYISD